MGHINVDQVSDFHDVPLKDVFLEQVSTVTDVIPEVIGNIQILGENQRRSFLDNLICIFKYGNRISNKIIAGISINIELINLAFE